MTAEQIREKYKGTRLVALCDGDKSVYLYAGDKNIEWPSDWPEAGITIGFMESEGFQVLTA